MQITPWNWVWTVTTAVLILAMVPRSKPRAYLPPFIAAAAVAASLAWSGIGGSWHFLVFPVVPLVFLGITRISPRSKPPETPGAGSITVPFGRPREFGARDGRPARLRTMAAWAPLVWAPAAVAAILLLALGVDEVVLILAVFPLASFVLAVLWGRWGQIGAEGTPWWTITGAPAVALVVAIVSAPDAVPAVAATTTTSTTTVFTTNLPFEEPVIYVDVQGTVARSDGNVDIVAVEGAFITFTGEDTARFALSDVFGHATFFADPGEYTVFIEPPDDRWAVMEGCLDQIEDFPLASGEEWTWVVSMVDVNAAAAFGGEARCDEVVPPIPGKGF